MLLLSAPALGGSPPAAGLTFACEGDGPNSVRVEVLGSGDLQLWVGGEAQVVPPSAYAATVGDLEASIADWHAGVYIPRRLRSIVTGQVPKAPPCRGARPIPDCQPSTDATTASGAATTTASCAPDSP